eukprot:GEMP01035694.1.p1 GENE.GEMP01035694.1~~GEMP01035694.1.p1  ORF type:complete len:354 (+),score=61.95 GEMP01035694.1:497-1558(+)
MEIAHGILLVIGDRMGLADLRLMDDMKLKCQMRNIPLFVWHNIRRTNPISVFRERMHSLYASEVDYTGYFDAPDQVCHLTGGLRAKLRIERVLHGLRATAGGIPSVGTLSDKIENAGSQILPRFFGGIGPPAAETSRCDEVCSDVSEMPFNLHLVFKRKDASESRRKRWWGWKNEPTGHFEVDAQEYSEPLELRCLHGAKGLSTGWVPSCCVYETTEPNGRTVKNLELEAPGVAFEDVEVQSTKAGVKVSMRKHVPYHDTFRTKIDEDDRSYGLFVRNFCFHDTDAIYQPVPPPEGLSMRDGVLLVRLWKVEMTKTVKKRTAASIAGDPRPSYNVLRESTMSPDSYHDRATAL